jgi:DNA-binding PucR family transcriptional regulator
MVTDPTAVSAPGQYMWFQTEKGPIGIRKSALSEKERALLKMFLTPYVSGQNLNSEQAFWHHLLFSGEMLPSPPGRKKIPFRLVHFYVKDPAIDADSFSEAVDGLFPSETVVLWETKQEGVIIEPEESAADSTISYEDLVEAVTSDFYTDLLLYVGRKQNRLEKAHSQFTRETSFFHICRRYFPTESVFRHDEQIPFLFLYDPREDIRDELFDELLEEVADDKELLHSIYQYLACDMNVTTAAKKLFIHRNSLQYRVDKFVEKTGLDVKSFSQAVTVFLALLKQRL